MREIKFRGLDDEGVWHYGALASTVSRSGEAYDVEPFLYSVIIEFQYDDKIELFYNPVRPETVGQFTGLVDKNGIEICEGDIISVKDAHWDEEISIGAVKYSEASFYIDNYTENYDWDPDTELEIIGNIHQNPELLKDNNNAL